MIYRIYLTIPSAPNLGTQNPYHINTLNNEYKELSKFLDKCNGKYQRYTKAIKDL